MSLSGNIRSTEGTENFVDRTKRKSRRSEKVSKMGGSKSKATVFEHRIKNLKKGLGEDYGVKPEKAMATHSSTLAWKIPWMEEPGRLQSMGLLRVGHN